jgi:hypothetical protein
VAALGEWEAAPLWIAAHYPQSPRQTLKVRLLVEFLTKRFGPEPEWDRNLPASRRLASRG